ncbi:MAG: hypothetical protein JWO15_1593 [Sphingomonadales bacterium]|nr:hypothetical protein [Sphingomonadales bacterium]
MKLEKDTKHDRGSRLRTEAHNCLAIAVNEKTPHIAGQLIDEAARLMRRSAELAQLAKDHMVPAEADN